MISPIRREILVKSTPEQAFELFTHDINKWWPLASYSVYGDGSVSQEDKELRRR